VMCIARGGHRRPRLQVDKRAVHRPAR
jgi:hypothetical protein